LLRAFYASKSPICAASRDWFTFSALLRQTAEQLTDLDRWCRILSYALIWFSSPGDFAGAGELGAELLDGGRRRFRQSRRRRR
jgi:hypothetical protein